MSTHMVEMLVNGEDRDHSADEADAETHVRGEGGSARGGEIDR